MLGICRISVLSGKSWMMRRVQEALLIAYPDLGITLFRPQIPSKQRDEFNPILINHKYPHQLAQDASSSAGIEEGRLDPDSFTNIIIRPHLTSSTQYMEKRVFCQLNGDRKVIGVLRGYDVRPVLPFAYFTCSICGA